MGDSWDSFFDDVLDSHQADFQCTSSRRHLPEVLRNISPIHFSTTGEEGVDLHMLQIGDIDQIGEIKNYKYVLCIECASAENIGLQRQK